jgi:choline dehydrogenase-like flavoprotein
MVATTRFDVVVVGASIAGGTSALRMLDPPLTAQLLRSASTVNL